MWFKSWTRWPEKHTGVLCACSFKIRGHPPWGKRKVIYSPRVHTHPQQMKKKKENSGLFPTHQSGAGDAPCTGPVPSATSPLPASLSQGTGRAAAPGLHPRAASLAFPKLPMGQAPSHFKFHFLRPTSLQDKTTRDSVSKALFISFGFCLSSKMSAPEGKSLACPDTPSVALWAWCIPAQGLPVGGPRWQSGSCWLPQAGGH